MLQKYSGEVTTECEDKVHLVNMEPRSSDLHSSINLIVAGRLFGFALQMIDLRFHLILLILLGAHLKRLIFQRVSTVTLERASTSSSSSLAEINFACSWSSAHITCSAWRKSKLVAHRYAIFLCSLDV